MNRPPGYLGSKTIKGVYWIIQWFLMHYQILHFQYCDSNIGLFSFASFNVIALIVVALKGDSEEER